MDRKAELFRQEDEGWRELWAVFERFPEQETTVPGVVEDWSAKDVLVHVACWLAEASGAFEQMRMGTYTDPGPRDIDAMNRRFYEATKDLDLQTVKAEAYSARNRMLQEWYGLQNLTPEAIEHFREDAPLHYREHAEQLRKYIEGAG